MFTNFPYGLTSMGVPVLGGGIPANTGKYIFADATNGNDGNDGLSMETPVKSFAQAYSLVTTNKNDVIVLAASSTAYTLTAMADLSKNRFHVVGLGTQGAGVGQRARLTMGVTTAITDVSAFKVTGTGCSFTNIKVSCANTLAQNISAAYLGGEANVYNSCSFEHTAQVDQTVYDAIIASDSCTYNNCKFGTPTVLRTCASRPAVKAGDTAALVMKDNIFNNCIFETASTQSTATLMTTLAGGSSVQYNNIFRGCALLADVNSNAGSVTLTVAIKSAAETEGFLLFDPNTITSGVGKIATAAVGNTGVKCGNAAASANAGMTIVQTN